MAGHQTSTLTPTTARPARLPLGWGGDGYITGNGSTYLTQFPNGNNVDVNLYAENDSTIDVGATFSLDVKVGTIEVHADDHTVLPNSDFNAVAKDITNTVENFAGAVYNAISDAAQFTYTEGVDFGETIWHYLVGATSGSDAVGAFGGSPSSHGYVALDPQAIALIKSTHI